jgi:cytochrome c biogenesis protein CcdA
MIRLAGIVISIGLADSLNPTTIAPALFLASGEHSLRHVLRFTLGVFLAYLIGGAAIALGPGQLLLSLVPHPDAEDREVIEVIVGAVMICVGLLVWRQRRRLRERRLPQGSQQGRSSAVLGATIMAVELPTAFPYFAAIAAIVGSGLDPAPQLGLLVLFNFCFVLPLLGIAATLWLGRDHAQERLARVRDLLQWRWPNLLAGAAVVVGVFVILLGTTGLAGQGHGHLGHFFRGVHNLIPH